MSNIIIAKVKVGKLQSAIVNALCDNATSYEPKDLATTALSERPEEVKKSNDLIKKLMDKIKYYNHFGEMQTDNQQFEAYIVKRAESSPNDFGILFRGAGKNMKLCQDSIFSELQSCWEWMLGAKDSQQPDVKKIYDEIDKGTRNWSVGYEDFRTKSNRMHELQHGVTEDDKEEAGKIKKSREEAGWDVLKKDCVFMKEYGFTCYKITEFSQINNVAHKSPWCVTWDSGGENYFYRFGSQKPPYYLITVGDEQLYALLNPSSHQFKSFWDDYNPFQIKGKVDRPSKTKIFDFANDILKKASDFDGKYEGDLSVLQNPVEIELDTINFVDLLASRNCPEDQMEEAIENTSNEEMVSAITRNPNCPYENLMMLANSQSTERSVLQAIGASPKLDDDLAKVLLDRDRSTSRTIALNQKCSEATMKRIINGKYDNTGSAFAGLLRQDYCKKEYVDYFVKQDKSNLLYKNAEMYRSLLLNQKTDKETLEYVIQKTNTLQDSQKKNEIIALCYKHPNIGTKVVRDRLDEISEKHSEYDRKLHSHQLGEHPGPFTIDEQEKHALSLILSNPQCDGKTLAEIASWFNNRPDDAEILIAIAENPNTPAKTIMNIVKNIRTNLNLALALIKNPNCPPGALKEAAILVDKAAVRANDRTRIKLINSIIENKNCTDQIKDMILYRPTFENIRDTVFPQDKLIELCKSDDIDIAHIAKLRLEQTYHKKLLPDGTVESTNSNEKKSSVKYKMNHIVASIVSDHVAVKIAKSFMA